MPTSCFGFYGGEHVTGCATCSIHLRCKSVLLTDGFQIVGDIVDQLTTELPEGKYGDTDRVPILLEQLLSGPREISAEATDLLNLLGKTPTVTPDAKTLTLEDL